VVKRAQAWIASPSNFRRASIFRQSDFGNQFVSQLTSVSDQFSILAPFSSIGLSWKITMTSIDDPIDAKRNLDESATGSFRR
jgi:hypothetical protein